MTLYRRMAAMLLLFILAALPGAGFAQAPKTGLIAADAEAAPAAGSVVPDHLVITFDPALSAAARAALLDRAGGRTIAAMSSDDYTVAAFAAAAASAAPEQELAAIRAALRTTPGIADVRYEHVLPVAPIQEVAAEPATRQPGGPQLLASTPNDEFVTWGLFAAEVPVAWDLTRGDRDVVIAVIDSGVDLDHPDLAGKLVDGYDFVDDDTSPIDQVGTGTAMAGIIAAKTGNSIGIAGVCPECRVMPLKVQDATNGPSMDRVKSAIDYAVDHEVQVIALSYAVDWAFASQFNYSALWGSILNARRHGIIVTCAAGDDNTTAAYFPAWVDQCLTVGALDYASECPACVYRWDDSNYGANVDLFAPGATMKTTNKNGGYSTYSGTHLSSAFVAGIAGLLAARGVSDDRIYQRLTQSSNVTGALELEEGDFFDLSVWGLVNAGRALHGNGVSNGTFDDVAYDQRAEDMAPGWGTYTIGSGAPTLSLTEHDGTYSMRMGGTNSSRHRIFQGAHNVLPGGTLTFWYYMVSNEPAGASGDNLTVRLHDPIDITNDRSIKNISTASATRNAWTKVTIDLSPYPNSRPWILWLDVINNSSDQTTVYLDDIKFGAPSAVVKNGGFESGGADWSLSGSEATLIADWRAQTGSLSAHPGWDNNANDWLEQTFDVPAGYRYLNYGYNLATIYSNDKYEFRVYNAATGDLIMKDVYDTSFPHYNRDQWWEQSIDLSDYSGYPFTSLRIKVTGKSNSSDPSSFYLDNVWMSAFDITEFN